MRLLSTAVLVSCCCLSLTSFAKFKEFTPPDLIVCDYLKKYQIQFDIYKNDGWITKAITEKTMSFVQPFSFKTKIAPVPSRDGTLIKYTFTTPNAVATIIMPPSGVDGKGTMIIGPSKKFEILSNCYQHL